MFIGPYGLRDNLDDFWMIDLDDLLENCFDEFFETWTSSKCFTIQNCLITELTILFLLCIFHFEFNLILWIDGSFL